MISKQTVKWHLIWVCTACRPPPPPPPKKKKRTLGLHASVPNGCRYKLECVHGARTPPPMQSSYILTKPKMNFWWTKGNNSWVSVLYSSLSNLKKTLWTKFHKVVIEIGRLIDRTPSKNVHEKRPRTPEYHYWICKIHYATKQCNQVIKKYWTYRRDTIKNGEFS